MHVGIVGLGRVGGAISKALRAREARVSLFGRGEDLGPIGNCDIVVLAVPDDSLLEVAETARSKISGECVLVHTSGVAGLDVVRAHVGPVGVVHPATPVATKDSDLSGVIFGVIAEESAAGACEDFVRTLGGVPVRVRDEDRVCYHAGLVHASNHLVALAADAQAMLGEAKGALVPLLRETLNNIEKLGPSEALTGPVSRGDVATVVAHLEAIPSELLDSYRANSLRAVALALASQRITETTAQQLRETLEGSA